jgi:hypothetical protein
MNSCYDAPNGPMGISNTEQEITFFVVRLDY